jgi:hypothetical protein
MIERMATPQNQAPPRANCPFRAHGQGSTKGTTAETGLLKLKSLSADYLNDGTLVPGRDRASSIRPVFQPVLATAGPRCYSGLGEGD